MDTIFTHGGKEYNVYYANGRYLSPTLYHPSGNKPIRFKSIEAVKSHIINMNGKALTCKPRKTRTRRQKKKK